MKPTRYISAGSIPVTASPQVVALGGQALKNMGETIQFAGQAGMQIAEKVRKIDETSAISDFLLKADEAASEFSTELLTRHDPDSWRDEWLSRANKVKDGTNTLGLSPEAKAQADLAVNDWASRTLIRFETQAANKSVELGRAKMLTAADYHFRRGDLNAGRAELQKAGELGLIPPHEVEKGFQMGDEIAARELLAMEIETDPRGTLAALEDGSFIKNTPGADLRLVEQGKRMAAAKLQDYRAQEMDMLETALIKGELHGRDIEAASYITDKDRAVLVESLTRNEPPSNEDHAAAWNLLSTLREARNDAGITQEQFRELWNEARVSLLRRIPPAWQGDIRKELSYLSPAGRDADAAAGAAKPLDASDLEAVGRDIAFRARDAGFFGKIDDDAPIAEREQAFRKAEDIRLNVKKWVRSQKEQPTPEQVREFTDSLISGDRVKSTVKDWMPKIPGSGQSLKPQAFHIAPTPKSFGITTATRDNLPASTPKARQVSLDFNDAANNAARGVEIIIPDDATDEERKAAEAYVKRTAEFFAKHGVEVPIRGVKTRTENGRGTPGRFHTEPFFVGHAEALSAIQKDPDGYASILAGTLGGIPGVSFIAPHKEDDPGAGREGINERDFARSTILPALRRTQARQDRLASIQQQLAAFLGQP